MNSNILKTLKRKGKLEQKKKRKNVCTDEHKDTKDTKKKGKT